MELRISLNENGWKIASPQSHVCTPETDMQAIEYFGKLLRYLRKIDNLEKEGDSKMEETTESFIKSIKND